MEQNVIAYYDEFAASQLQSGINDRIYYLFRKMKALGMDTNSHVLELGSGVGALTYLLSRTIKQGKVEAVDISSRSVDFIKSRIKKANIFLEASDITSYQPILTNIDFITLFDVIEHIPMEQHRSMFANIGKSCTDKTLILINIPNPQYIEYDRIHHPDELQIIDQALPLQTIVDNLEANDLEIVSFENYSIWVQHDYQFFVVRRKRTFEKILLASRRSLFEKVIKKIERLYIRLFYRYQ